MGQDGHVLIRHASAYYRMHPCQLMRKMKNEDDDSITFQRDGQTEKDEKTVSKLIIKSYGIVTDDDSDLEINSINRRQKASENNEEGVEHGISESEHLNSNCEDVHDESGGCGLEKPKRNTFIKFKIKEESGRS